MKTNEFRQGIIRLRYFSIFIQIWPKPLCRAMLQDHSFKLEKQATILSVPKRRWLSGAGASPACLPPSPQLPNQLHCDTHWSPLFFPKYVKKGYLLWRNLKAATYTWQNSLLVSIFNYNRNFWCAMQSAGGMLLASTNDRGHTGRKMTPNAQWTEKNPRLLDLWKTSTTILLCNPKLRWTFNSSSITEKTFFLPSN